MININHLTKYYANHAVLNDVHFTISTACIVGLAGVSGGGKSTLLRCIQGLESVDAGTIECQGQISHMFQDFQLFPHMTVLQNLIYAPSIKSRRKTCHRNDALLLLETLALTNKANTYPAHLSGGQKQRVALARSLMMKPDILLCDEPTSGLDVGMIADVIALLRSVKSMGVTMMIASHDLEFLTALSDRILLLKEGTVVADIQPSTIVSPIQYLKKYY
jgi:polar amino acid transport system ATP-binding protein